VSEMIDEAFDLMYPKHPGDLFKVSLTDHELDMVSRGLALCYLQRSSCVYEITSLHSDSHPTSCDNSVLISCTSNSAVN